MDNKIPTDHVVAFGAGHSVYDDAALLRRAEQALAPFPNVILILPSPDEDESFAILLERMRKDDTDLNEETIQAIMAVNRTFLFNPSNPLLAKFTIYTKDRSVEETCQEIIARLRS